MLKINLYASLEIQGQIVGRGKVFLGGSKVLLLLLGGSKVLLLLLLLLLLDLALDLRG